MDQPLRLQYGLPCDAQIRFDSTTQRHVIHIVLPSNIATAWAVRQERAAGCL